MDALSHLMGEGRIEVGGGLWLRRASAAAYLRGYTAKQGAGENDESGNVRFLAELIAGGLEDGDGKLVFADGSAALEGLPITFILKHADDVTRLNGLDDSEGEGLEGKSEIAP